MTSMYAPIQDGRSVRGPAVRYTELPPSNDLSHVIHCHWELRALAPLTEDFHCHALPHACVNLLFNLLDTGIAAILQSNIPVPALSAWQELGLDSDLGSSPVTKKFLMDAQDWKIRYVQRWTALTGGKDDPHASWNHAEAAFLTHSSHLPEAVAEERFEELSGE